MRSHAASTCASMHARCAARWARVARRAAGRYPSLLPRLQVDAELRGMETASVKDYVQEADSIAGLYGQIESCEAVLGEMQGLLAGFQVGGGGGGRSRGVSVTCTTLLSPPSPPSQENLGGISAEIRQLQAQSLEMSVKMANRKRLAGKVMGFLRKARGGEAGKGERGVGGSLTLLPPPPSTIPHCDARWPCPSRSLHPSRTRRSTTRGCVTSLRSRTSSTSRPASSSRRSGGRHPPPSLQRRAGLRQARQRRRRMT